MYPGQNRTQSTTTTTKTTLENNHTHIHITFVENTHTHITRVAPATPLPYPPSINTAVCPQSRKTPSTTTHPTKAATKLSF
ncbi:hypothetical protein QL285_037728 [Trifolium repens]|nr:hypothetical protein QL285_037728 [Trifolium repens]